MGLKRVNTAGDLTISEPIAIIHTQDGRIAWAHTLSNGHVGLTVVNPDGSIAQAGTDTGLIRPDFNTVTELAEGANGSILAAIAPYSTISDASPMTVQMLSSNGALLGPAWHAIITRDPYQFGYRPDLSTIPLANGNTLVLWAGVGSSDYTVMRAEFDANGNEIGSPSVFTKGKWFADSSQDVDKIAVTPLAGGEYLVRVLTRPIDAVDVKLKAFVVDANGVAGLPFTYNGLAIATTALAKGGFLSINFDYKPEGPAHFIIEKHLADGTLSGQIADTGSALPYLAELPDGRILIAWSRNDIDLSGFYGRVISADGKQQSKPFVIKEPTGAEFSIAGIWVNGEGKVDLLLASTADIGGQATFEKLTVDPLSFIGSRKADIWHGGKLNDLVQGKAGDDLLFGHNGNDRLNGGTGDDWLEGGKGADTIAGGAGMDTASFKSFAQIQFALDGSFAASGGAELDRLTSIESLEGTLRGADRLRGNSSANVLWGLGGDDRLEGMGGNDKLNGGAGADKLLGGSDRDTASYERSKMAVQISLDGSLTKSGDAAGDILVSIENLTGTSAGGDTLAGNRLNNTLEGLNGNDTLFGRAGNDTLFGGKGKDILDGGNGFDMASYADDKRAGLNATGVHASLDSSISATGAALGDTYISIEGLTGTLSGNDMLSGNAGNNILIGLGGNDRLNGRDGNDRLTGGDGKDFLRGGKGADTMDGGAGIDTASFSEDQAGILLLLSKGAGRTAEDKLKGIESVIGSKFDDYISGDDSDNSISGLAGDDKLFGGLGNDTLDGGLGENLLSGGAGDDRLISTGSRDRLEGGPGKDTFLGFASDTFVSYEHDAAVVVSLDGSVKAQGEAAFDVFDENSVFYGLLGSNRGADKLYGDSNSNELWGLGGDDLLSGKQGQDFLYGGAGHDTMSGGAQDDYFIYADASEGGDKITDFGSLDVVLLLGSQFGLTSTTGQLNSSAFATRATKYAENQNERLIFRTTDKTLWFDSDGTRSAKSVMLFDLQSNYDLQADDFFIA